MNKNAFIKISRGIPPVGFSFGEKGLRLLEMKRRGFNVPDGVVLSVEFLQGMVDVLGMRTDIEYISQREAKGEKNLDASIAKLFEKKCLSRSFKQDLENETRSIEGYNKTTIFAVRSAASGEDQQHFSFAGQYSTILNVTFENIWKAIYECYSSWWTNRAVSYRKQNGIFCSKPKMSIIIQRQLIPEYSGVLFTKHPFDASDTMVIEAVAGIGEKLVSGYITPARWEIDPYLKDMIAFEQNTGKTTVEIDKDKLFELIKIGNELEKEFGAGLDIEWAVEKGEIYLLQIRPISTLDSRSTIEKLTQNVYSRSIVEDLWSDQMSDITSSIIFDEMSDLYTFKAPLRKLKLYDVVEIQAVTVVNGYGYLSTQAIAKILELIPKFLRFREIHHVFPPSIRDKIINVPFKISKVLKILHRIPLLVSDIAVIPFLTEPILRKHLNNVDKELTAISIDSYENQDLEFYKKELERLLVLLSKLQIRNQWGYGNGTTFTWFLHHFAVNFAKKSEDWFLSNITSIPHNVTLELQLKLRKISEACDKTLIEEVFRLTDKNKAWKILQTKYKHHEVTKMLEEFIFNYRFRSANRDFIHPRWDEKPELVLDLVSVLLETGFTDSKHESDLIIQNHSSNIARNILFSPILFVLVTMSKKFLALREDLRFGLDKVFYRIRKLLLAVSNHKHFSKLNQIENGIFFLRLNELRTLLLGQSHLDDLLSVIKARSGRFHKEQSSSPPFYIMFDGEHLIDLSKGNTGEKIIRGTAASPGIAEGRARIIRNEKEFHKLKKGDILIAYNTDPGWTPLFVATNGVAVEMGGILNHCAIVAREYKVPAVVGVERVTQIIKDGQLVRINGGAGTLEVLE